MRTLYFESARWNRDSDGRTFIPNGIINGQQQTYQHFEDPTFSFMSDRLRIQGRGQGDNSIKSGQLVNRQFYRSFIYEARFTCPATLGAWLEFWAFAGADGGDTSEWDVELLMSVDGVSFGVHNVSLGNHPYVAPTSDSSFLTSNDTTGLILYNNAAFDKTTGPHYYTIYYDDTGPGTIRRYIDGVLLYHVTQKWNASVGGTGFGPDSVLMLDLAAGTTFGGNFPGTIASPSTWTGDMDIYSVGIYAPGSAGRAIPAGEAWGLNKTSSVTLSGSDLIVTAAGSPGICLAIDSIQSGTGRYYWEILITGDGGAGLGLYSTDVSLTDPADYLGRYPEQLGWYSNGTVVNNNAVLTNWATFSPTGPVRLCLAYDKIAEKLWGRVGAAGNWNNAAIGSQNPAVGSQVGGTSVPSAIRFNVVPGVYLPAGGTATMVAASGSWVGTPPAGFGQIGPT